MDTKLKNEKTVRPTPKTDFMVDLAQLAKKHGLTVSVNFSMDELSYIYSIADDVDIITEFYDDKGYAKELFAYLIIVEEPRFKCLGKEEFIQELKELARKRAWLLS